MVDKVREVGLGEWAASDDAEERLVIYGLGSCVAVVLYDAAGIGGLAHVVLPESHGEVRGAVGKYADRALPLLYSAVVAKGALPGRLVAFLAGGAQMFPLAQLPDIGAANVAAVRKALQGLRIPIIGQETGGHEGRTVHLSVGEGAVHVIRLGQAPRRFALRGRSEGR